MKRNVETSGGMIEPPGLHTEKVRIAHFHALEERIGDDEALLTYLYGLQDTPCSAGPPPASREKGSEK